jgi:hypothetical protein
MQTPAEQSGMCNCSMALTGHLCVAIAVPAAYVGIITYIHSLSVSCVPYHRNSSTGSCCALQMPANATQSADCAWMALAHKRMQPSGCAVEQPRRRKQAALPTCSCAVAGGQQFSAAACPCCRCCCYCCTCALCGGISRARFMLRNNVIENSRWQLRCLAQVCC